MSAPDFKATAAQGLQAAQDLLSHRTDWQQNELDVATDILTLGSVAAQGLLKNSAPGPVLAVDPSHKQSFLDAHAALGEIHAAAPVGSILSETGKFVWAQLLAWFKKMGWIT